MDENLVHIITCTEATLRFEWELEVLLTNLNSFNYDDIIVLFCGGDKKIVKNIETKYNVNCHYYEDKRPHKSYPTSNRPYLWTCFLKQFPEMSKEDYFYIDTDIILREKIDFSKYDISKQKWLASDCSSYLQPSYIKKFGDYYFDAMVDIVGIEMELIEKFENCSGGAQWIISQPKLEFWEKVYKDSENIYVGLTKLKYLAPKSKNGKGIQPWCADMWALLWNTAYFNIATFIEPTLSFSWSINDISEWDKHIILHNAGVCNSEGNLFFKGEWNEESPLKKKISVDETKCSYYYVEAIKKVSDNLGGKNV